MQFKHIYLALLDENTSFKGFSVNWALPLLQEGSFEFTLITVLLNQLSDNYILQTLDYVMFKTGLYTV